MNFFIEDFNHKLCSKCPYVIESYSNGKEEYEQKEDKKMNVEYKDDEIRIDVDKYRGYESVDRAYLEKFEDAEVILRYDEFGHIMSLLIKAKKVKRSKRV